VSIEFLIRQQRNHVEQLSGVERSGNARGDSLIGCPIPNSSIEQWHMLVIVTGYTLFVASHHDVISTFANNVLLKFVDIICLFSKAGPVVGQGGNSKTDQGNGNLQKRKSMFLFINNVDLKTADRNYSKSF